MSERECDRAAARIAPPANESKSPHKRQTYNLCRGGACSSRKQTHTTAQTASTKNGTSKPVPYKRTSTAKHPPAVILSGANSLRVILSGVNTTVWCSRSRTRPKGGRHCEAMTGSCSLVRLPYDCYFLYSFSQDVTRNGKRLSITVRRSHRHFASLHSSVLLHSAMLHSARLRLRESSYACFPPLRMTR